MQPSNDQAPRELVVAVQEFFPSDQVDNMLAVCWLESQWNAFALNDTTRVDAPCGTPIGSRDGVQIFAERSVGYAQINSCDFPDWEWERLYNARHNIGTAHLLWSQQGWSAWYFSAQKLGLI